MSSLEKTQLANQNKQEFSAEVTQICSVAKTLNLDTKDITLPIDRDFSTPPTQINDKYDMLDEIGRGGMGKIFLWKDKNIQRLVATKMLIADSQSSKQRFFEEGQITGQLEHPNIIPLHEIGIRDENLYFTMKYVRGKSLQQVITEITKDPNTEWTINKVFRVFLSICDAIEYAHSKKVIHRDLKPSNIMIGNFGEVMVMDWGLAKVLGQKNETPQKNDTVSTLREDSGFQTIDGQITGTPIYMSPEQARGEANNIDQRSDIYTLGMILYEILSGKRCVEGETTVEIVTKVCQGKRNKLTKQGLFAPISKELISVIEKAIAFDKEDRYQSVRNLSIDIQRFLDHRQVSAYTYNYWDQLQNIRKRYHKEIILVMATSILFIAAFFAWGHYKVEEKSRKKVSLAQKQMSELQRQFDFLSENSSNGKKKKSTLIIASENKDLEKTTYANETVAKPEENVVKEELNENAFDQSKFNENEFNEDETPKIKPKRSFPQKRIKKDKEPFSQKIPQITREQFNRIKEVILNSTQKYQSAYEKSPLPHYKKLEADAWNQLFQAAKLMKDTSWQEIAQHQMRRLSQK